MAALKYVLFVVYMIGVIHAANGASTKDLLSVDTSNTSSISANTSLDSNVTSNSTYDEFKGGVHVNKVKKRPKCDTTFCHNGVCVEDKEKGAMCTCPDDRMYLADDGKSCNRKSCTDRRPGRRYSCGSGANCNRNKYDVKYRLYMPQCVCPPSWFSKIHKVMDPASRSCVRDPKFKTCDWPVKVKCDQKCSVVSLPRSRGTRPQCTCKDFYQYDNSLKKCIVTNPCKADNSNGGCQQMCNYNKRTLAVSCSCHSTDYTLAKDGRNCLVKSCQNKNDGCQHNCIPLGSKDYYCTCNKGYHLNNDKKTCYDYDECSGHHGCDQKCLPDGKGYFICACDKDYYLAADGYSCRASVKCINHGCSQHCNPTTGACYCDSTHQLGSDGRSCVDIDECARGTHNCQEKCVNTEGGFICDCFDAKARLSNDLRTCVLDTCKELDDIQNGKTTCTHGHSDSTMKAGDYCTFTCNVGFKLVGATLVKCTQTGYDYVPPHCANINECSDKFRCGENEICSDTLGSFACLCDQGYQKENGKCVDKTGPAIQSCPSDKMLELPEDSDSITYKWAKPIVFDPTDAHVRCINCPPSEEQTFGVGSVTIKYVYSDDAGNMAFCSFKVKVADVTPPEFQNCTNGTVYTRRPGVYDISEFAKVTATDNSGKATLTHDEPPQFKNPGLRTVNYHAKDESGNSATCSFFVDIVVNECPELSPPENGFHGCNDWHIGTTCTPNCNVGFAFFNTPATEKYLCGDDGTWNPVGALPKCYPVVQPEEATLMYVSKYQLSGSCPKDDPAALKQIVTKAQNTFDQHKSTFCFAGDSCSLVRDPEVDCKVGFFTLTLTTDENYSRIPEHDTMIVEFKKKIQAVTVANPQSLFMGLVLPPMRIMKPLVDGYGLPTTPVFEMQCPPDSKKIGNKCVTCPVGVSC